MVTTTDTTVATRAGSATDDHTRSVCTATGMDQLRRPLSPTNHTFVVARTFPSAGVQRSPSRRIDVTVLGGSAILSFPQRLLPMKLGRDRDREVGCENLASTAPRVASTTLRPAKGGSSSAPGLALAQRSRFKRPGQTHRRSHVLVQVAEGVATLQGRVQWLSQVDSPREFLLDRGLCPRGLLFDFAQAGREHFFQRGRHESRWRGRSEPVSVGGSGDHPQHTKHSDPRKFFHRAAPSLARRSRFATHARSRRASVEPSVGHVQGGQHVAAEFVG